MKKKIDINNEKQILKKCNIEYFYNSEVCSSELCMFFNDICCNQNTKFDKKQALIDLGRIAITLNEQHEKNKELENELNQQNAIILVKDDAILCGDCYCINNDVRKLVKENQQLTKLYDQLNKNYCEEMDENIILKQSQNSKAIEVLEQLKNDLFDYSATINIMEHKAIRLCNIRKVIDNQITELRGEMQ